MVVKLIVELLHLPPLDRIGYTSSHIARRARRNPRCRLSCSARVLYRVVTHFCIKNKESEASMLGIKVEIECEAAVVKQELDVERAQWQQGAVVQPNLYVSRTCSSAIKMKDETDNFTIKQELEIEPTVLQSKVPSSPDMLTFEVAALDPRPSTSFGFDAAAASRCTATSGMESEDNRCEGYPRVPYDASFVIHRKRTDNKGLFKKKLHNYSENKDMSMDAGEGNQCRYGATSPTDCDCTTATSGDKTDVCVGEKLYGCDYCKYDTARKCKLINHICPSMEGAPCICKQNKDITSHQDHLEVHTGSTLYKCMQCEYSSSTLGALKTHMVVHSDEKPYKCELCPYRTSQGRNLKIHMRIHTGEKPYKCKQCGYSASHLGSLKLHIRTHTGERPFKCSQCEYSASELGNFKKHMRTHTGEKPYKCEQCEYSASEIGSLKRHTRTHTGERPYKCEQCEFSASRLGSLKRHVLTHTGEKPFKCEYCEYSAFEQGSLKRHMRTHTGEKPYKCEQCEFSASRLGSLKRHMQIHIVSTV